MKRSLHDREGLEGTNKKLVNGAPRAFISWNLPSCVEVMIGNIVATALGHFDCTESIPGMMVMAKASSVSETLAGQTRPLRLAQRSNI